MKYFVIPAFLLLAVTFMTVTAGAVTSQLRQDILPTDCVLTNINNGSGQQSVADCPTDAPVITEVATTPAGTRVVRGVVDQSRISTLRVLFLGQIYIANTVGSPLTLANDIWVFTLELINPIVEAGEYMFTVESIVNGQTLTTTALITLPSLAAGSPDPGSQLESPSNAARGFPRILSPASDPLNADIEPPVRIETDLVGNTLIWIDNGVGAPSAGYLSPGYFMRGIITVVAVILVLVGRSIFAVVSAFIQHSRR